MTTILKAAGTYFGLVFGIGFILGPIRFYVSPLARVLGTVEPSKTDWLIVSFCVIAPIIIVELTKAAVRWTRTPFEPHVLEIS